MTELFSKLESPALTDIQLTLPPNVQAEQANDVIPDLYAGETLTAVFKLNTLPSSLEITGKTMDGQYTKTLHLSDASDATGIDVLWARRKIERLMDAYNTLWGEEDRAYARIPITQLAIDYHLVSKFTSLVATDITPSRPGLEHLATKAVTNKMDLSMFTPRKIAYQVQTATNASLWMLLGLLLMFIAFVWRKKGRHG